VGRFVVAAQRWIVRTGVSTVDSWWSSDGCGRRGDLLPPIAARSSTASG